MKIYLLFFCHFSALRWCRCFILEILPRRKEGPVLHSRHHDCCWCGDARHQGISNYVFHQVCLQHCVVSTTNNYSQGTMRFFTILSVISSTTKRHLILKSWFKVIMDLTSKQIKLWVINCVCTGVTSFLHWVIDIFCDLQAVVTKLMSCMYVG